ncbi:hypothetical protein IT411_00630 [Candidatus Peregrinibacteria bacterium]|nr:hypothetical protein [Candidatus Peregrinibacteria bacterium]
MIKNLLTISVIAMAFGLMNTASAKTWDPNFQMVSEPIPVVKDCYHIDQYIPATINMDKLRSTWLEWNNKIRREAGLTEYTLEPELSWSAQNWSDRAKRIGAITHKRDGQSVYYDYNRMIRWFRDLGLEFKNVNSSTMTENIGWGYYKCPADGSDCTEAMTKAIKTTYDFFASERKANGVHWRSMVNKNYREIGLGLALDAKKQKYYLTIHYATEITSNPKPICEA